MLKQTLTKTTATTDLAALLVFSGVPITELVRNTVYQLEGIDIDG